jgi:hypothetical protein
MKQLIHLSAAWIGAAIQNVGANLDFEVLSWPGGSLIAVLLWLYASAMGFLRRRPVSHARPSEGGAAIDAGAVAPEKRPSPNGACVGCRC